jgi:hypothetical protein
LPFFRSVDPVGGLALNLANTQRRSGFRHAPSRGVLSTFVPSFNHFEGKTMSEKEMAARPVTTATTSDIQHVNGNAITRKSKVATILALFVKGLNLNRFEAESHHDHCLHSTVSSLEGYGVRIARSWETIPCLGGKATVRCKRYWLESSIENIAFARAMLTMLGGCP